jgi:hypothetical protein
VRRKAIGRALRADVPDAWVERLRSTLGERARIVDEGNSREKG